MTTITIELSNAEASAVHHALYLRLRELAFTSENHDDAHRRIAADNEARNIIRVADQLREKSPKIQAATKGNTP